MVRGGDQDPDDGDRVLSPEDLDIESDRDVASLGDDRYVIGLDGPPSSPESGASSESSNGNGSDEVPQSDESTTDLDGPSRSTTSPPESTESMPESTESTSEPSDAAPSSDPTDGNPEPGVTGRAVKQWLSSELDSHDSRYAYHIAAKYGTDVAHQQLATDDVGAAFDGLLVWYARQVADSTPVDEALGILLGESSIQIRYPTACLVAYLDAHDLDAEDSIADLVSTVAEEDGLALPRKR